MFYNEDFDNRFYSNNEKTAQNPPGRYHQVPMPRNERRTPHTHRDYYDRNPYGQRPGEHYGQDDIELPPPPKNIPSKQPSAYAVDPRSIRNCVRNYTYIWLSNGQEFWMYPTYAGRSSISGYRWNGRYGWVYYGVDLDMVESFFCLPY